MRAGKRYENEYNVAGNRAGCKAGSENKEKGFAKASVRSFSMECNVIGMRVAEALPIIDKYLDNAVLAKANNVRIIHGMGTGALRKGVHDFLKRNPRVESFRMGDREKAVWERPLSF